MVSKSLKKIFFFISFFYICINSKILVANDWLIGSVGTFQGLDKITARIKTFEIKVGVPKKFGGAEESIQECFRADRGSAETTLRPDSKPG